MECSDLFKSVWIYYGFGLDSTQTWLLRTNTENKTFIRKGRKTYRCWKVTSFCGSAENFSKVINLIKNTFNKKSFIKIGVWPLGDVPCESWHCFDNFIDIYWYNLWTNVTFIYFAVKWVLLYFLNLSKKQAFMY